MNLLPKASGNRPHLACEIAPEGVAAARALDAVSPLESVARVSLAEGAVQPSLKPGNIVDRVAVVSALRRALEQVGGRPNARGADISIVIPDGAARVLLLDFDALPNKLSEALPVVRFRLKKLLPFEADDAMISYQIMSSSKAGVRVLAVAIPRDVLAEYETLAREAGFEPGAVLPSTLATLPLVDGDSATLLVNANRCGVTTAIVQSGLLLLHRSVDLQPAAVGASADTPSALFEPSAVALPLVDRHDSASEWAAQEPVSDYGRATFRDEEPGSPARSPYNSPTLQADLNAELHNAIYDAPTSVGTLTDPNASYPASSRTSSASGAAVSQPAYALAPAYSEEIARAVSVAAAYFEDTLALQPSTLLSAGALGAEALRRILEDTGISEADGLRTRELVESERLSAGAAGSVPRSALAGVAGALRG